MINRRNYAVLGGVLVLLVLIIIVLTYPGNEASSRGGEIATGGQCTGDQILIRVADGKAIAVCYNDAPPTSTPTLEPTATATPTFTPVPSDTPTPTATHFHPTETATVVVTAAATGTATPIAQAGQICPAWVHNLYVTTGPDGKSYPTWHPQIDPTYGCHFGHDHGVDPATSSVNPSLPAFGYINAVSIAGGNAHPPEAHAGFKVFVWNCGESGDQGANRIAGRAVVHMGTSGTARFTLPHHSVHYSAAACDGSWALDVQGMVDFPGIGSICGPRAGRDFATVGCVQEEQSSTAYEIWTGNFQVMYPGEFTGLFQARAYIQLSPAVFDPVLAVDPTDLTKVVYTANLVFPGVYDPLAYSSPFRGCKMEAYQGPVSINNRNRPTIYVTDVFGNVLLDALPGDPGTLIQTISAVRVNGTASNASANGSQFKQLFDMCSPVIKAPN